MQRYRDKKIRVCDKNSIPFEILFLVVKKLNKYVLSQSVYTMYIVHYCFVSSSADGSNLNHWFKDKDSSNSDTGWDFFRWFKFEPTVGSSATPLIHYFRSIDQISNFPGTRWSCFQPSDSSTFTERMGWPESDLSGRQRGFNYSSVLFPANFDFRKLTY